MDGDRRSGPRRPMAVAAAAGLALLAAGCGRGSSPPVAAGDTVYQRELGYAQCMRAHRDPGFPDPQSNGAFISTIANRDDFHGPAFTSANKTCAHLEGPGMTPAQQEQFTSQALRFAACMRAHGITTFQYSAGQPGQHGSLGAKGADINSTQFQAAQQACRRLQPALGNGS